MLQELPPATRPDCIRVPAFCPCAVGRERFRPGCSKWQAREPPRSQLLGNDPDWTPVEFRRRTSVRGLPSATGPREAPRLQPIPRHRCSCDKETQALSHQLTVPNHTVGKLALKEQVAPAVHKCRRTTYRFSGSRRSGEGKQGRAGRYRQPEVCWGWLQRF